MILILLLLLLFKVFIKLEFNEQILNEWNERRHQNTRTSFYYLDDHDEEENIEQQQILQNETQYELRDYQREALERLNSGWTGIQLLHLPCGCGKTLIFNSHLRDRRYKNVFIVSPLKCHAKQNLERTKTYLPDYDTILLDSDKDGTTDYHDLEHIFEKPTLISTTFKSCENLFIRFFQHSHDEENSDVDFVESEDESFEEESYISDMSESTHYESLYDLSDSIIIIDEAHNLINQHRLQQIIKSFPNVLLVTATPVKQMEEIFEHELIYSYPFRQAIEEKHICDYQIYLPLVVTNEETNQSEIYLDIPDELMDLDNDMTKKCLFLINGLLKTGSKKCIVYLSRIEECELFENVFKEVMLKYHYLSYWIKSITCSTKNREKIIDDFEKNDENQIHILCSIRILDEGIDIKSCDSIFLANISESSNIIIILQRICRGNRLDPQNKNKIIVNTKISSAF